MGKITKIMRSSLFLLIMVTAALAAKSQKRTKPPYVADAVGNALPPPSVVPATVGSPVNLLTPDRYEFYTFDESGELVKRLMTLEEIQAIVAAGEDGDTPVTFDSNDNPTIAFNFSQPSNTKVHSVVTNVQNVLKAQMEAHRNKPYVPPTLDTPDVSDSWSLILPSIFGNSDVDILPDKSSTATTPESETFIIDSNDNYDHLSKEGSNQIPGGTTLTDKYNNELLSENISPEKGISENEIPTTTTTTTTTTKRPTTTTTTTKRPTTTTTTTRRPTTTTTTTTTTKKPTTTTTTTTTKRPTTTTTTTTTKRPTTTTTTTTTKKPTTTTTTTTKRPTTTTTTTTTTKKPTTTTTTTTEKPTTTTTTTTIKPTTRKPTTTTKYTKAETTTRPSTTTTTTEPITTTTTTSTKRATTTTAKPSTTTTIATTNIEAITTKTPQFIETFMSTTYKTSGDKDDMIKATGDISESNFVKLQIPEILNPMPADENNEIKFEKISTFIPVSTINFVTEKSTYQPDISTVHITVLSENDTTEKNSPSTIIAEEKETTLITTVTTQSVPPFTTVSSTETSILDDTNFYNSFLQNKPGIESENNNDFPELPMLPLFDVAQSFSQIASDLGSNYQPLPTVNNLLDTTKYNPNNFESKENLEIDIPSAADVKEKEISTIGPELNSDNFVKISTLDPQSTKDNNRTNVEIYQSNEEVKLTTPETSQTTTNKLKEESTSIPVQDTTMDPVLSGSMNDLLSQIVNQAAQSIIDKNTATTEQNEIKSTENIKDITTAANVFITNTTFENYDKTLNDISSTTEISEKYSKVNIDVTTDIITTIKEKINENDINFFENTEATEKPAFTENADNIYMEIPLSTSRENLIKESYTLNDKFGSESNVYKEAADIQENETTTDLNITTDLETTTINQLTTDSIEIIPTTQIINTKADSKPVTDNKLENLVKFNTTKKYKPSFLPKVDDPINIEEFKKKIQKVNIAEEELISERNNSWKLISTGSPPRGSEINKDKVKYDNYHNHENHDKDIVLEFSKENQGLEVTTKDLEEDIAQFTELCNELAFRYWDALVLNIDKKRSFVISPFSITSMLAMMFMGARGSTSGEMNEILKLDDMVTFNPHFTFKNISDSIETTPQSGIIVSAFIRELYSDRNKGKILTFYKERAQHFYNGHVEEINFKLINDIIRRRTNLLVKRFSWGRIPEFMKTNTISLQPPLAAFSANIFQTDCTGSSVDGRDGEMYFVVSPNVRQRRLVPVPAVVYRAGFLAGYDPVLDATAAALGTTNSVISTLFLMPGQQGNVVHADDLENLEKRLLNANPTTPTWNRLLRTLLPRIGLELQIPRFSHKSLFNVSSTLKQMGLNDLFDADHADLGGLNGPSKDLYLSDMIQWTTFVTCGEGTIGEQHHIEEYPELLEVKRRRSSRWVHNWDEPRDYQRAFHDPHDVGEAMNLPLHLRPRQARLPSRITQPARLKYDRPFLYFVRHNPSGMILYVGRYNPRLLP